MLPSRLHHIPSSSSVLLGFFFPRKKKKKTTPRKETMRDGFVALGVCMLLVVGVSALSFGFVVRWPLFEGGRELKAPERTVSKRIEAVDRLVLSPYSVAIFGLGVAATWSPAFSEDLELRWYARSAAATWCLALYCAKTFFDVCTQVFTWREADAKRSEILLHHVVSFVAIGYGLLVSGQCHFWGCLAALSEGSTIFLNNVMAVKLFTAGQSKAQKLFVTLNGVLLWLSYILCRLTVLPFWLYRFAADLLHDEQLTAKVSTFQLILYPLSTFGILLLSCYWFLLITKGLLKALGLLHAKGDKQERSETTPPLKEQRPPAKTKAPLDNNKPKRT